MRRTRRRLLYPLAAMCTIAGLALIPSCGELEPVETEDGVRGKADRSSAQQAASQIDKAAGCRAAYAEALNAEFDVTSEQGFEHFFGAVNTHTECLSAANKQAMADLDQAFQQRMDEGRLVVGDVNCANFYMGDPDLVDTSELPWECQPPSDRMKRLKERAGNLCQAVVEDFIKEQGWEFDEETDELANDSEAMRASALHMGCFLVLHDAGTKLISRYYYGKDESYDYEMDDDVDLSPVLYESQADAWRMCLLIAKDAIEARKCKKDWVMVLKAIASMPTQFMPEWAQEKYQGQPTMVSCPRCPVMRYPAGGSCVTICGNPTPVPDACCGPDAPTCANAETVDERCMIGPFPAPADCCSE